MSNGAFPDPIHTLKECSRLKDAKFSLPEAVNLLADLKIKLS